MQPSTPGSGITHYVGDASWLPHAYAAPTRSLQFAHAPREAQRAVPFVDERCLSTAPRSPYTPIAALPPYAIERASGDVHFIFHTAFCCSTLVTRAFDAPGVSMGLKEPNILVALANIPVSARRERDAAALRISLDLLSRPLELGETQIVKPSNAANTLAGEILDVRSDAKAVVLHSSLDDFLRSIAARGLHGRLFARSLFLHFAREIPLSAGYTANDLLQQSDLQIAAQAWLMQARYLASVAQHFGPARVRFLSSKALLADTPGVLSALADFFNVDGSADYWREVATGPVFTRHSKSPDRAFDADARAAAQTAVRAAHGDEVDAVLQWSAALARHCAAPLHLGDTLVETTPQPRLRLPKRWLPDEIHFGTSAQLALAFG